MKKDFPLLFYTSGIHEGFAQAAECLQIVDILEECTEAAADQLNLCSVFTQEGWRLLRARL